MYDEFDYKLQKNNPYFLLGVDLMKKIGQIISQSKEEIAYIVLFVQFF